jgi:predicted ribosome quality control (RQC) complex YloA/Tae2 family protein
MKQIKPHTMDYAAMNAVVRELAPVVEGGRLFRAFAVGPLDVVLILDTDQGRLNLLISADARYSRVHLVSEEDISKDKAKLHISNMLNERDRGARLDSIKLEEWERIVKFTFVTIDVGGTEKKDTLIAELMGKHSNVILLDQNEMIIGSLKAIHSHLSSKRQVRAGLSYKPPPPEDKLTPQPFSNDDFGSIFRDINPDDKLTDLLIKTFKAMSPSWASMITSCARLMANSTCAELDNETILKMHKCYLRSLDEINSGKPLDIEPTGDWLPVNSAYASFYQELTSVVQLDKQRSHLLKIIRDMRKSSEKLAKQLKQDLASCEKRDDLKRKADAVLAAAHEIPKGAKKIELTDVHSPDGSKITVELDPSLPPTKLAAKWYDRYNKLKRGEAETRKRLDKTMEKLDVLISAEDEAKAAKDLDALNAAAARLEAAGLEVSIDREGHISSKPSGKTYKVHRFRSSDGFEILVGGNQAANDYLTQRLADREDIWLHAKEMPGSHVIIRTRRKEVPSSTLNEAANIAAWYSDGREGSKVPVDYTKVKHVRKPPGAKAGYVTYKKQRTIRVDPDEGRIRRLEIKEDD